MLDLLLAFLVVSAILAFCHLVGELFADDEFF